MKVRDLYKVISKAISTVSPEAEAEAKWIVEELFGKKFEYLFVENPSVGQLIDRANEIVRKRVSERIPLQYLFKKAFFYGFELYVDERVLIPRSDTEVIVDYVLETFKERDLTWLDLGTGSGAIALALDKFLKGTGFASDVSMEAISVANVNANKYGARFMLIVANLFSPFKDSSFDLIVSNPPYIAEAEKGALSPEVLFEPPSALLGGKEGFEFTETMLLEAQRILVRGGSIIIETSPECYEKLKKTGVVKSYILVKELYDLSGELRGLHLLRSF